MDKIRVVDLFGGIGGFRRGLQLASNKYEFVWYCDIDKHAVSVYNKNFGECYEPTDITKIKPEDIPEFDIEQWAKDCENKIRHCKNCDAVLKNDEGSVCSKCWKNAVDKVFKKKENKK